MKWVTLVQRAARFGIDVRFYDVRHAAELIRRCPAAAPALIGHRCRIYLDPDTQDWMIAPLHKAQPPRD